MKRIGILTSGGDCQGLNASIRGVAKSLYEEFGNDVEIYGIKDGYKGLIFGEYKLMKPEDFSGILTLGGTILGTNKTFIAVFDAVNLYARRYHFRHLPPAVQTHARHR